MPSSASSIPSTSATIDQPLPSSFSYHTAPIPFTAFSPCPLRFSTADVTLWFQRLHAQHRIFCISEELYYELLNCLDDTHLYRISRLIKHKLASFSILKEALLRVFDIAAAQRQFNLTQIPSLEDSIPSDHHLSAAWPSGSERCFYDGHYRKFDGSTPTQALLLRF